jgi:hypothetical protein
LYALRPFGARVPQNRSRATPFVRFCSTTFFCARKNASHFSLSGTKKRRIQPERYTFYQSVELVVNWFLNNLNNEYFKDKVVYLNADNTRSAFWIYFKNNFKKLGLKELIATHYDGSGLSCTPKPI